MRRSDLLLGCAALLTFAFYAPVAQANVGDDNFVILAQGVPGPPVGGTTGAGGNGGGAGDYDAGTERGEAYDAPMNPATFSNYPNQKTAPPNRNPANANGTDSSGSSPSMDGVKVRNGAPRGESTY